MLGAHPLSFLTRWLHVASMALLLGGGLMVWAASIRSSIISWNVSGDALLLIARKYESLSWLALGLLALTGVGNLAVFGPGLPAPGSLWGNKLLVKLSAVMVLMLYSLLRTLLIVHLTETAEQARLFRLMQVLYASTCLLIALILFLAVSLAHA